MHVCATEDDLDTKAVSEVLRGLLDVLPEGVGSSDLSAISPRRRRELRELIVAAIRRLEVVAAELDPVRVPLVVFDPADPDVVGRLIGETMLAQDRVPLGTLGRFHGSGVYALYYKGDFPAYVPIRGTDTPIYVGKADPATRDARTPIEQGQRLWERLNNDHAKSIRRATNLDIDDFDCRYLVVRSAWQGTAEDYLIGMFRPVWNKETRVCQGFGKHGDKHDRRSNTRSAWDTLHPGRPLPTDTGNRPNPLTPELIVERILEHYRKHPPST